ncbi:MAG: FHA domain-containing protein [Bdellovibrionota bacterium]
MRSVESTQKVAYTLSMAIVAEVLEGPQKGMLFQLVEGRSFGRLKADYLIKDENVSSTHCKIARDEKGQLVLIDLDSSNGLLVNSRMVKKVLLIQGVTFVLGDTPLRIKTIPDKDVEKLTVTKSWRSLLRRFFSENLPTKVPVPQGLQIFKPTLELEFVSGLQAEQKKVLSYGPRFAGFNHLDIDIEDSEAPNLAFEIQPQDPSGALLINKSGFKVLLNKAPVDRAELKEGDLIQVGRATLKISFVR